ncbi:Uncharacterized protein FWK35_00027492 [Aphis craccivora]|uniref:Uncharacterized protein n=1 Tax=Aphis craccivora TaxID=307492 RepID=A0A6G0Y8T3_APHCR|nr:Uncharacterized protein FWK35_00027492 [Aphis craccivora]
MVQRKFLSFAGFILNIHHQPHDYVPVSKFLNIDTLSNRRITLGVPQRLDPLWLESFYTIFGFLVLNVG